MKILDLSLTYHWYDMIAGGEKKEEYREIKDFYITRLVDRGTWNARKYDAIRFHRGQGSPVTMLVECLGIEVGKGRPEWGAPEEDVFIIKLGEIIKED